MNLSNCASSNRESSMISHHEAMNSLIIYVFELITKQKRFKFHVTFLEFQVIFWNLLWIELNWFESCMTNKWTQVVRPLLKLISHYASRHASRKVFAKITPPLGCALRRNNALKVLKDFISLIGVIIEATTLTPPLFVVPPNCSRSDWHVFTQITITTFSGWLPSAASFVQRAVWVNVFITFCHLDKIYLPDFLRHFNLWDETLLLNWEKCRHGLLP